MQGWIWGGEGCTGCVPPSPEMTCGFVIQLVFTSSHQSVTPLLSGATLPNKNPGSAPVMHTLHPKSESTTQFIMTQLTFTLFVTGFFISLTEHQLVSCSENSSVQFSGGWGMRPKKCTNKEMYEM